MNSYIFVVPELLQDEHHAEVFELLAKELYFSDQYFWSFELTSEIKELEDNWLE